MTLLIAVPIWAGDFTTVTPAGLKRGDLVCVGTENRKLVYAAVDNNQMQSDSGQEPTYLLQFPSPR